MGVVQLRQIRNHLLERYVPYIDISDYEKRSQADQENAKLTRALSAFAIANEADLSPEVACTSVVDGYNDNGIDAIYYSAGEKVLYLCQSKWSNDGSGSLDEAGALKFVKGVLALLTPKFEDFNDKIRRRQAELDAAINNASRIVLISAHSGSDRLGDHANRVLSDCLSSLNDTGEVAVLLSLHQENLYTMVAEGGRGEPVNLAVQLFDWGATKNPYQAFYGQVAASDVAEWGVKHRHRIFFKNIRTFLGASTAVNEGIADSIKKSPQNFWYLNNGITALCSKIQKRAVGGNTRDAGTFDCEDVAIVNGAQTVGVITELSNISPEQLAQARVPIRLISLENCPEEFAMEVTRATNTQNRVDSRNFVALDPHQDRIRAELLVDGIEYEYRQGEGEPTGDRRFGLVDATVALACSRPEVDLAVQAKREISKLWEDMDRPPYRTMFNKGLTGLRLWHLVQVLRLIDAALDEQKRQAGATRRKNMLIHGNRFIAHKVMNHIGLEKAGQQEFDISAIKDEITDAVSKCADAMIPAIDAAYTDSYLASLFKNVTKCRGLSGEINIR